MDWKSKKTMLPFTGASLFLLRIQLFLYCPIPTAPRFLLQLLAYDRLNAINLFQ